MVGGLQTAALVGSDGSVDWLCFPRFDSPACFAALLGGEVNGRWRMAPTSGGRCTRRRYRGHTLVLETEWETPTGAVRVIDCMPPRGVAPDLVRDRKSTRLNSSHANISYAVFCLKKNISTYSIFSFSSFPPQALVFA